MLVGLHRQGEGGSSLARPGRKPLVRWARCDRGLDADVV